MSHFWHSIAHTNEGKYFKGKQQLDLSLNLFYVRTFPVVNAYHKTSPQTFMLAVLYSKLIYASSKTYKESWHPSGYLGDEVWQPCSRHSSWVVSAHIWKGLVLSSKKAVLLPFSMMGQDTRIGSDSLLQRQICLPFKKEINGWFRDMFLKCHNECMYIIGNIQGIVFWNLHLLYQSDGRCLPCDLGLWKWC